MSKRSIDEVVKGIGPDVKINVHDALHLDNAYYISKRGNVEAVDASKIPTSGDEPFRKAVEKVKKQMGDKAAIVARTDATHYGFINRNFSFYNMNSIKSNAKTWIQATDRGRYGKPVQTDHDQSARETLGRVMVSTPIIYPQQNDDLLVPNGHIELIYNVTDKEAIEKMMDGRFRTVSVGASSTRDQVKCSICGESVSSWDCEHTRGKYYDIAVPGSKDKTQKQLAFWIWDKKTYNEVSFVGNPADAKADTYEMEFINIDGIDSQDNNQYKDAEYGFVPSVTIMGADFQDGVIASIKGADNESVDRSTIVLTDSIVDTSLDATPSTPESQDQTAESVDVTLDVNTEDDSSDELEETQDSNQSNEPSSSDIATAYMVLVSDMLKNKNIDKKTASDLLANEGIIYIASSDRSVEKMIELIDAELSKRGSELTSSNVEDLSTSCFCGPNGTFPVYDAASTAVAKELLNYFDGSESTKARISDSIERKSAYMMEVDSSDTSTIKKEDQDMAKFSFDSVDEMLASPAVKKAIDEAKTEAEQALDQVKQDAQNKEATFVKLAIDAIIDLSTRLDKPSVATLKGKDGADKEEARKAIVEKLEKRSLDALQYSIDDLREEVEALPVADSSEEETPEGNDDDSQAAVESAIDNEINPESEEGKDGEDGSETETSEDGAGETDEPVETEDSTAKVFKSVLSSFTKKKDN